jgi:hypothetical protein
VDPSTLLDNIGMALHRLCRNCIRIEAIKGKTLCSRCYAIPSIREEFRQKKPSEYNIEGRKQRECERKMLDPRGGTEHYPGTYGKLLVLCERRMMGCELWHPHDAGMIDYYEKLARDSSSEEGADTPVLVTF